MHIEAKFHFSNYCSSTSKRTKRIKFEKLLSKVPLLVKMDARKFDYVLRILKFVFIGGTQ